MWEQGAGNDRNVYCRHPNSLRNFTLFGLVICIVKYISQSGNYGGTLLDKGSLNWEVITKATAKAAKSDKLYYYAEHDDIVNECITFLLEAKNMKRFSRYITGETTTEKINKLSHSLSLDKSWLSNLLVRNGNMIASGDVYSEFSRHSVRGYLEEISAVNNIQLNRDEIINVLRSYFKDEVIDNEKTSAIVSKFHDLKPMHQSTLLEIYKHNKTNTQIARENGLHRDTVGDRRDNALNILMTVRIPVYYSQSNTRLAM